MSLGERIRSRRLEMKLTQRQLAAKCGVTEATINRYESGDIKNPSMDIIRLLTEALRTEPNYLMGWDDVPIDNEARYASERHKVLYDKLDKATPEQIDRLDKIFDLMNEEFEQNL